MSTKPITFHDLHARYSDEVYRFAYWLSGNTHDASDLASETFVRAWAGTDEIRMESIKAYLFAITRNLHRQQWRRRSRQVSLDESVSLIPDPGISPDEHTGSREELRRTLAAMEQLPELDRAVLLMRAQADLSYGEIAGATGLSEVAVKVKVFRARAKLATLLNFSSSL